MASPAEEYNFKVIVPGVLGVILYIVSMSLAFSHSTSGKNWDDIKKYITASLGLGIIGVVCLFITGYFFITSLSDPEARLIILMIACALSLTFSYLSIAITIFQRAS
jgi:hypothetical protein